METFLHYLPMANLLFFFLLFVGIAVWAFRPSAKEKLQKLANIALKEDLHG
jgi:cbb3-type cytochrome oxidase subunit 3